MSPNFSRAVLVLMLSLVAGCGSSPLIPNEKVAIAPGVSPSVANLLGLAALGAAAYYIIDPLAPNWEVRVSQVDDSRYTIDMRKKRFSVGGDGEARALFRRYAQQLVNESGSAGYVTGAYEEGIDSETTYARRFASGWIRLTPEVQTSDAWRHNWALSGAPTQR